MRKEIIGNATLYLGDCLEVLPTLPKVDAVITDPPYGIERFKKGSLRFDKNGEYPNGILWDNKPEQSTLDSLVSLAPEAIIWGANNFNLPTSEYFFVWDKQQTVDNFASAELAYTNIKVPAKVFRYSIHQHNQRLEKDHPTQKPVALMLWCLSFTDAQMILDPFMGSGTTGVACMNLGRKFIGIEIEPKYFDIACERIENAQRQERLFA
jgi:site-specific DNA-methyltransferase (adenine-specific)/modification methylase